MEQRHADVGDVVGVERQDHQHRPGHEVQSLVTGDHRLGCSAGSRGEEQQERRTRIDRAFIGRRQSGTTMLRHQRGVVVRVGVQHRPVRVSQIQSVEQFHLAGLGDHDLTRRVLDVAREFGPAPRGIDAHHHRSGYGRHPEPHGELGGVFHQHADVRLRTHRTSGHVRAPPGRAFGDRRAPFTPRESTVLEQQCRTIIVRASPHMIGECGNGFRVHGPPRGLSASHLRCIRHGRRRRRPSRSTPVPPVGRRTRCQRRPPTR